MLEITLYPQDIEHLQNGERVVMYEASSGKPWASLILDLPEKITKLSSKLPTENVDNPVSNCT